MYNSIGNSFLGARTKQQLNNKRLCVHKQRIFNINICSSQYSTCVQFKQGKFNKAGWAERPCSIYNRNNINTYDSYKLNRESNFEYKLASTRKDLRSQQKYIVQLFGSVLIIWILQTNAQAQQVEYTFGNPIYKQQYTSQYPTAQAQAIDYQLENSKLTSQDDIQNDSNSYAQNIDKLCSQRYIQDKADLQNQFLGMISNTLFELQTLERALSEELRQLQNKFIKAQLSLIEGSREQQHVGQEDMDRGKQQRVIQSRDEYMSSSTLDQYRTQQYLEETYFQMRQQIYKDLIDNKNRQNGLRQLRLRLFDVAPQYLQEAIKYDTLSDNSTKYLQSVIQPGFQAKLDPLESLSAEPNLTSNKQKQRKRSSALSKSILDQDDNTTIKSKDSNSELQQQIKSNKVTQQNDLYNSVINREDLQIQGVPIHNQSSFNQEKQLDNEQQSRQKDKREISDEVDMGIKTKPEQEVIKNEQVSRQEPLDSRNQVLQLTNTPPPQAQQSSFQDTKTQFQVVKQFIQEKMGAIMTAIIHSAHSPLQNLQENTLMKFNKYKSTLQSYEYYINFFNLVIDGYMIALGLGSIFVASISYIILNYLSAIVRRVYTQWSQNIINFKEKLGIRNESKGLPEPEQQIYRGGNSKKYTVEPPFQGPLKTSTDQTFKAVQDQNKGPLDASNLGDNGMQTNIVDDKQSNNKGNISSNGSSNTQNSYINGRPKSEYQYLNEKYISQRPLKLLQLQQQEEQNAYKPNEKKVKDYVIQKTDKYINELESQVPQTRLPPAVKQNTYFKTQESNSRLPSSTSTEFNQKLYSVYPEILRGQFKNQIKSNQSEDSKNQKLELQQDVDSRIVQNNQAANLYSEEYQPVNRTIRIKQKDVKENMLKGIFQGFIPSNQTSIVQAKTKDKNSVQYNELSNVNSDNNMQIDTNYKQLSSGNQNNRRSNIAQKVQAQPQTELQEPSQARQYNLQNQLSQHQNNNQNDIRLDTQEDDEQESQQQENDQQDSLANGNHSRYNKQVDDTNNNEHDDLTIEHLQQKYKAVKVYNINNQLQVGQRHLEQQEKNAEEQPLQDNKQFIQQKQNSWSQNGKKIPYNDPWKS